MYEFHNVLFPTKGAMLRAMLDTYYGNHTFQELTSLLGEAQPSDFAGTEADAMIEHWALPAHMERTGYSRADLVAALATFWRAVDSGIDPRFDY